MTRVRIAFGLFCAILALSFTEYFLCRDTSEKLLDMTRHIEKSDDIEDIKDCTNEMQSVWNKRKTALEIFLYHSDADEIENSLEKIKRLAEHGSIETIYLECGSLNNKLISMKEAETIQPHNIL